MELTKFLNSYGHEMSGWPQLYNDDANFIVFYHTLSVGKTIPKFHLRDGLLCHLSHLFVPSSDHENMIWKYHYSEAMGHFGVDKIVAVLKNHFYWSKL
jgi:hypothetical protein